MSGTACAWRREPCPPSRCPVRTGQEGRPRRPAAVRIPRVNDSHLAGRGRIPLALSSPPAAGSTIARRARLRVLRRPGGLGTGPGARRVPSVRSRVPPEPDRVAVMPATVPAVPRREAASAYWEILGRVAACARGLDALDVEVRAGNRAQWSKAERALATWRRTRAGWGQSSRPGSPSDGGTA